MKIVISCGEEEERKVDVTNEKTILEMIEFC